MDLKCDGELCIGIQVLQMECDRLTLLPLCETLTQQPLLGSLDLCCCRPIAEDALQVVTDLECLTG